MAIKGLRKVSGVSFEEIVGVLDRAGVPYRVGKPRKETTAQLMDSRIYLSSDPAIKNVVRTRVGEPNGSNNRKGIDYYHADYQIQPGEGFNLGDLNGLVRFTKGLIFGRTIITYQRD